MRDISGAPRSALKRFSWGGLVLALIALFGLPTAAFAAPTTVTLVGDTVTVTGDATVNQVSLNDTAHSSSSWIRPREPRRPVQVARPTRWSPAGSGAPSQRWGHDDRRDPLRGERHPDLDGSG